MTTKIITARTGDLSSYGKATYALAHNAAVADSDPEANHMQLVGQILDTTYYVYRSCLEFDISTITAAATAAILSIYGIADWSYIEIQFDLVVVSGEDISDPFVVADYHDLLGKTTSWGSFTCTVTPGSTWSDAYHNITLNATGLAALNAAITGGGGKFRIGLRSSRDISNTTPTNSEHLAAYDETDSGKEPILTVTYPSSVYPTDPLLRVSGIVRSFWAGIGGQAMYQAQIVLGGLTTTYVSPIGEREPQAAAGAAASVAKISAPPSPSFPSFPSLLTGKPAPFTNVFSTVSGAGYQIEDHLRWLSTHSSAEIKRIFGHQPTYGEWVNYAKSGGKLW